ncbi:MAG: alpha-galactosidase [Oscillospiraceae bacterium]|jgi:alpha-galactosidase|nr:alpha-galactosidase [Oscillospiraceae bacterium]
MAITFDEQSRSIKLDAGTSSYVLQILPKGQVVHRYWGAAVSDFDLSALLESNSGESLGLDGENTLDENPDHMLAEYPGGGAGDFRVPAVTALAADGSSAVDLRYVSHEIQQGKPALAGLPAVYLNNDDEAETLAITLEDKYCGLRTVLYYTVFAGLNVITRHTVLSNVGVGARHDVPLQLNYAMSSCVEFSSSNYKMLGLYGAWARERQVEWLPLRHGTQSLQSRRGYSSHQMNPFTVLATPSADEVQGEVYGFNLVYSGSFLIEAEVDQKDTTRVVMGINPYDFAWKLEPGETFTTPEAVLVYSNAGMGEMSRTYHRLYTKNLCRGAWRDKRRPILINNWEATYFKFNADKLVNLAEQAASAGIEMLVMDDGWFGKRDGDNSGLGDWFVNEEKLGCSLAELVERVDDAGLKFGIWFEPEMVNPDSDLFRAHPDWALSIPSRPKTLGRHQLALDMSRKEVRDYLVERLTDILNSADISYVKWDCNRYLSEAFSATLPAERGREIWHRYMLGFYDVLERITSAFPKVLFESCASGGGRFDPAMLYYMPQTWTSDNTDAIDRLKIQYGTSFAYPIRTIGAHVSATPNHQTGRNAPFMTRGAVALQGTFGYELDLAKLDESEFDQIEDQIDLYQEYQKLIFGGDFYRLISPFEDSTQAAWMYVSPDKKSALVQVVMQHISGNHAPRRIRLQGLEPQSLYKIEELGVTLHGDSLMNLGFIIPESWGDHQSVCLTIKRKG